MPQLAAIEGLLAVPGIRTSGVAAGIKQSGRPDVALVVSDDPDTTAAALFTTNAFAAAPVHLGRQHIADGRIRAIAINAGNANACTGRQGLRDALTMARTTAEQLDVAPNEILVCSTGIIGRPLPIDKVTQGIQDASRHLDDNQSLAAQAILTTDSGPKETVQTWTDRHGNERVIGGMGKGAGMIHPNMATMLAFVATDAKVDPTHLREALVVATDQSFHQISIDGDESTNDTVAVLATAKQDALAPGDPDWDAFQDALTRACQDLARGIAADGEGASRLLEVQVHGARTATDARRAARAVAGSTLVKCAVQGADPNWGRIVAALGQSCRDVDPTRTSVAFGPEGEAVVLEAGTPVADAEEAAHSMLDRPMVHIHITMGDGPGHGTAWGCDLTTDYVSFNAEYST